MRRSHGGLVAQHGGPLTHEHGASFDPRADRVCVLVHWSDTARVSRSVEELLRQFVRAGYETALVSAATCSQRLAFTDTDLADQVSVFRRPNVGYDFGSWASFLHAYPGVRHASRVVLVNDSLVGPFESIQGLLADFDRCPTDIWGLTGTTQDTAHLQSHFVGYKDGVLAEAPLRRFWEGVRIENDKRALILRYEIGLSRLAFAEGYVLAAHFPWNWSTSLGQNPTSAGWRRLILNGFPFVKRELVLRPSQEIPDVHDVPEVVRQRWGQDVLEWI